MINVTYFVHNKDKTKQTKKTHICFSTCYDTIKAFITPQQKLEDTYITYTLTSNKFTEQEIYKYLLFLRKIPKFKEVLQYPKKLAQSKEITFNCKHTGLHIFLGFTLFRALEESPEIVQDILKVSNKKTNYTPLQLIKIISYNIKNEHHWIYGKTCRLKTDILTIHERSSIEFWTGIHDIMQYKNSWVQQDYNEHKILYTKLMESL